MFVKLFIAGPEPDLAQTEATALRTLGTLCITLAGLWYADRDGPQGVFLQPIAWLLARKTTQRTARARVITDRRELCRGSLDKSLVGNALQLSSTQGE